MRDKGEKRAAFWGAIIGAVSGALLAVQYRRLTRQRQIEGAKPIETSQVVRLGMSMATVLRQFLELLS
jgi:membrane associated rhomboid family serine protease